jgi:hypothetical protein
MGKGFAEGGKTKTNIGANMEDYRKDNVENINEKKRFENKQNDIISGKRKKAVYERESKLYERELKLNPPGSLSYDLVKKMDDMGDVARSAGKKMGVNLKDIEGQASEEATKRLWTSCQSCTFA